MSEPTTEAGRRLAEAFTVGLTGRPDGGGLSWNQNAAIANATVAEVEAEARAAERERIATEQAQRMLRVPAIRDIVERLADDLQAILHEPLP